MNPDKPVYKTNSLVKIAAYGSLFAVIVTSPFCIPVLLDLPYLLESVLKIQHPNETLILGFTLWSAVGYLLLLLDALLLFTAKSESLLRKHLLVILYIGVIPFILFAILGQSLFFLIYGLAVMILQRWIINKALI